MLQLSYKSPGRFVMWTREKEEEEEQIEPTCWSLAILESSVCLCVQKASRRRSIDVHLKCVCECVNMCWK